jgi:hypothetical protein
MSKSIKVSVDAMGDYGDGEGREDFGGMPVADSVIRRYKCELVDGERKITRARKLTFVLDYPLAYDAVEVRSRKNGWTVADIVSVVQQIYRKIYKRPGYWGIWGHGISDLVIEQFEIKHNNVRFHIGS